MSANGASRWVALTLNNSWVVEYAAADGGVLRVEPGEVAVKYRLIVGESADSESSLLSLEVRLADEQGRTWQAATHFTPEVLMEAMLDPARREPAHRIDDAPRPWRPTRVKKFAPMIMDILDSHAHRYFALDGGACHIQFVEQEVCYWLGRLSDGTLVVQAEDLIGSWCPFPEAGTVAEDELEVDGALPPLLYPLDVRRLLFRSEICADYLSVMRNDLPFPPVFRRLPGKDAPQRRVRHAFRPVLAPRRRAGGDFVKLEMSMAAPLTLPTTAGGDLGLEQEREYFLQVGFSIAPHSEREPVDVICGRYRLADEDGGLWEAVTHFTPEVFVMALGNMMGHHRVRFDRWKKGAPAGRHLLAGVRGVLDDGVRRTVLLEDWAVSFEGKGQSLRFDLFHRQGDFLVRLGGLVGRRRRLAYDGPEISGWKDAGWSETGSLPPIVYDIPTKMLLFRNTTFAVDDGFWHGNDLPIPLVYDRLQGKVEAQCGIAFCPKE